MSTRNKIIIIVGCAVSGALNGCSIALPDLIVIFSTANILVATIIATLTGISISRTE